MIRTIALYTDPTACKRKLGSSAGASALPIVHAQATKFGPLFGRCRAAGQARIRQMSPGRRRGTSWGTRLRARPCLEGYSLWLQVVHNMLPPIAKYQQAVHPAVTLLRCHSRLNPELRRIPMHLKHDLSECRSERLDSWLDEHAPNEWHGRRLQEGPGC